MDQFSHKESGTFPDSDPDIDNSDSDITKSESDMEEEKDEIISQILGKVEFHWNYFTGVENSNSRQQIDVKYYHLYENYYGIPIVKNDKILLLESINPLYITKPFLNDDDIIKCKIIKISNFSSGLKIDGSNSTIVDNDGNLCIILNHEESWRLVRLSNDFELLRSQMSTHVFQLPKFIS